MTSSPADETSGLLQHQINSRIGDGVDSAITASTSDGHSQNHHHHDHGSERHISEKVPLYARPRQRQRWDEKQILPHVNWGDLYFDLFYVAAAYNLSHGFKDSPTMEGFLFFIGCYLPVFQIWNEKLVYDSRFCPEDNLFHRSLEVLQLCLLGTGIWHIQPCYIMKDTINNPTSVIFTASIMLDATLYLYLYRDIYYNVEGGSEARNHAWLEVKRKIMRTLLYGIAFSIAAWDFFFIGRQRDSLSTKTDSSENFWPIYVIIFEFLFEFVAYNLFEVFVYIPHTGRSHKEFYVPVNLEFLIHRIGEWVMLMLGESALSILTTRGEDSWQYSTSFYCGILTITMFQYLFFRSQPSEAKDHAMRRSQLGGFVWAYMHTIYSASLILVGCSYKMMLSPDQTHEDAPEDETPTYDFNKRIAFVYAASQFTSFLSLDFMLLTHRGFRKNFQRFVPANGKRIVTAPWIITGCNLALLFATLFGLSQIHDLTTLSIAGCLLVFGQVLLRTMGMKYFPITVEAMERAVQNDYRSGADDTRRWPNVTEPGN